MAIEVPEVTTVASNDMLLDGIDFISDGDQYLTFVLGKEHYGVDILSVREIRGWEAPTIIPNSPSYVKGVINLRGVIVPIIDLRKRFEVSEPTYIRTTVVVVLIVKTGNHEKTMGFVVDAVSDVINADDQDVQVSPDFGGSVSANYVHGLVNVGDNVVTLLDVKQLLTVEDGEVVHHE
ncbi:chemotaxis protein CheW [Marinibactrum halimedae]|nr:chemotaxis protein CheW [Marinibactrum halimedae]MCD9460310.1 chemotaxis protein CheW [Marinibactrum halimedae]